MKSKIKPRIQLEGRESLVDAIPLSTPWVIFVDPSDLCNFRCKFCPTGDLDLMKKVGRRLKVMDFDLYKKIIDDICEFDKPIKVLRLYKDGEPLLNPNFVEMIKYAKDKGCSDKIDTTTNASLLNPKRNLEIVNAGLDRINISIEGVNEKQYKSFSDYVIKYGRFLDNIGHLYDNKGDCEIFIKINGDTLTEQEQLDFYMLYGDVCDSIAIEHTMNCWTGFNMNDVKQNEEFGVYGQPIKEVEVCPYPFYSISINSEGTASVCFLDWARKMIIGDVRVESVKEIWNGDRLYKYQEIFLRRERKTHTICFNCSQLSHGMPVDLDVYAEVLYLKLRRKRYDLSCM